MKMSVMCSIGVAVFLVLLQSLVQFSGGDKRMFIIKSGSMSPTIEKGALVISAKYEEYDAPDIVTFASGNGPVTHRIKEKINMKFMTQGDANNTEDPGLISNDEIIGRVEFAIPYLGYILQLAKQPVGFIFLILIPLSMFLIGECTSVFRDFRKKKYAMA